MNETQAPAKSPMVAYLLWFFLGCFGAHRFYFGRKGSGFGMLGLMIGSAVGSLFVIGLFGYVALFCWWFVDAFMIGKWLEEPTTAPATSEMETPMSRAA